MIIIALPFIITTPSGMPCAVIRDRKKRNVLSRNQELEKAESHCR